MKRQERQFWMTMAILIVLLLSSLGYDLWLISSHSLNPNKHLPGVYEVVLGFWIFVVWKIEYHLGHTGH